MESKVLSTPRTQKRTTIPAKLLITWILCLFISNVYAQPAVTITNGPTLCGGTNGMIRISNLLLNQTYIVYYKKNGVGLPGAFALTTDGSGNLDIVTWGTFTVTAGTYSDIQITDGVTPSFFAGPYVLTDPAPPNPAPTSNSPVCEGGTLNLSTTMLGATYLWSGPNGFSSNSMAPSLTPVTAAHAGTYTLRVVANSTLCTTYVNIPVVITPTPTIGTIADQTFCNGTAATFVLIPGMVSGTTYAWTNSIPSIGLAASGTGNIPGFTASNTTNAPVTSTVTITPTANGCTGPDKTYTITVNPTPAVNAVSDKSICNNTTSPSIALSSAVSGTTFAWTNNKTSIGLAGSGTSNIPSFMATNSGTATLQATIFVTPTANNCVGTTSNFKINVNPTPVVGTIANQSVCNNATTTHVSIPGSVGGTTFAWTNDNTATGLAASGTGNILSFTATNTTNAPLVSTISITPTANGCTGPVGSFTITAKPTPSVNTVSNQTLCNNTATTAVTFSGPVSGTTFAWTNNRTSTGLAASGTGNISSFTASNGTNAALSSTIVVTPTANGCTGTVSSFTITVKPTPMVGAIATRTLCNGATSAAINIPATVSGSTFTWTNSNTSIGLAANGSGNLPAFTAINTGTATETGTVAIVPTANGCTGPAGTAEYIIHPTPTIDSVASSAVCNGEVFQQTTLTSPVNGSTFTWTNNKTSIGLVAGASSAIIPGFPASNTTTAPVTATITANVTANGCAGIPRSFNITVNPTPVVNTLTDVVVCNLAAAPAIGFTSPVNGTTYAWTNSDTTIGLPEVGTGGIATFTAKNSTAIPVIATVTVTPTANNCIGIDSSYTITVNPTPMLSSQLNPAALCNKTLFSYVPTSGTPGTTFAWSRASVSGIANKQGSGINNPSETLDNTTPNPLTVKYIYTLTANACSNSQTVSVVINPTPKLTTLLTANVCGGSRFIYMPATLTAGTTYTWSRQPVANVTPATRTGTGNIVDTLNNGTKQPIIVTYNYILTANGCTNTEQIKLRLDHLPDMPVITTMPPARLCSGTMYQNFGVSTPPGIDRAYYWTADNAVMWAQGKDRQYSIVSFPKPGKVIVKVTAIVSSSSCKAQAEYNVDVNGDASQQPDLTYFKGRFITLFNAQSYQWGYDDKASMDSTIAPGETGQDYYVPHPDFDNKYYWVMTMQNGCMQKTYYNKPLDVAAPELVENTLKLYPNPATDKLTIELQRSSDRVYQIALYDLTGRILMNINATGDRSIVDVADLPAGIYTISCYSDGVRIVSSRFAKN